MRTIRAVCPFCTDEVDLRPRQITLHVAQIPTGAPNRYGFQCPQCDVFVVKHAGATAVELLLEGGVELSTGTVAPWERPTARHPEDPPAGPAFTREDLLRLHDLLEQDDWFDQLLGAI